eukprot:Seg7676.2 transcript_id=Seg7676.2/GoldUCD/mRNA.D3Y31 product="Sulfotransferase family cytosolic 1B member 1" protein_id=Seg7676.2/GoldUCD/D3Y31
MSKISSIPFTEDESNKLTKVYAPFRERGQRYIRTKPGNTVLPEAYEKFELRFKNWQLRADDIYVLTFPKNGATWSQELVWCVKNGCDIMKAKSIPLSERVPFLERPMLDDIFPAMSEIDIQANPLELIENMSPPRIIKSHLSFCLLPDALLDKSKVVLCIRNPKDTVVSYFHHEQLIAMHGYEGNFETYFNLFMDNMVLFCSYFDYVAEAWKRRHHPNLCLLTFEDMKKDQGSSVRKVANFLGKDLSEEQVGMLVEHLSFKRMKENRSVNFENLREKAFVGDGRFMRNGKVGDWKNYFTEEMSKRMDDAIDKYFKPIGLEFVYEL